MRILDFSAFGILVLFPIYWYHYGFIHIIRSFSNLCFGNIGCDTSIIKLHCIVPNSLKYVFMCMISFNLHNDPVKKVESLLPLFYRWENADSEKFIVFSTLCASVTRHSQELKSGPQPLSLCYTVLHLTK